MSQPHIQMKSPRLNVSKLGAASPLGKSGGAAPQPAKDAVPPAQLKTAASGIGNLVHHGVARKVIEDQNLVYVSKLSPFCRFLKWTCLVYLVMLAITVIFVVVNNNSCGLDANQHTVRMRNVTTPVNSHGFVGASRDRQAFATYDGHSDAVQYVDLETNANLVKANMSANLTVEEFPLQVVLNYTQAQDQRVRALVLHTAPNVSVEDGGAAFDVVLENPKRKRVVTQEPWFNFDYWLNPSVQFSAASGGNRCGAAFTYNASNATTKWNLAPSTSPDSIVPMYYLGLENLTTKHQTGSCAVSQYDIDLYLSDWFCFSPLLVRQAPAVVSGANATAHGDLIFDQAQHREADDQLEFSFNSSKLDRLWVTTGGRKNSVRVSGRNNQIVFYVPAAGTKTFYGISGNQTTKESTEELYQASVQTEVAVAAGLKFRFPLNGRECQPADATRTTTVTVGESVYKFEFETA